ncbi:unnamed protein product, partial [Porites evermanni]
FSFQGLVIVTGFLCNYANLSCMPLQKFKLMSVYRHRIKNTNYSYMKVEVQSGIPTKIAFDGLKDQKNLTEFHFENCPHQTQTNQVTLVTTIHWKSNINGLRYYLAVRAGQIRLEQVSSVTDHHRFFVRAVCLTCTTYKIRSVASNKYIKTDSSGQATLGTKGGNRKAFFRRQSC